MIASTAHQNMIWKTASDRGLVLFRNNVGMGWTGDSSRRPDGSVLVLNARPLHAGLIVGSGDLIGYRRVTITPDMVGSTIAQFVSIESKYRTGRPSKEQRTWHANTLDAGGLSIIARGPEDIPA